MENEQITSEAVRRDAMLYAGLVVLLERAGGSVTFTEAEYQAILERFGSFARTTVRMEVLHGPGVGPAVRLTLAEKTGDLPPLS